mgnify:CR=1 FL=1
MFAAFAELEYVSTGFICEPGGGVGAMGWVSWFVGEEGPDCGCVVHVAGEECGEL